MTYGVIQTRAFIGIFFSWVAITLGAVTPFWEVGKIQDTQLNVGLWYGCISGMSMLNCQYIKADGPNSLVSKFWVCRFFSLFGVFMSLMVLMAGCCKCCGGLNGRTIPHGIVALVAGSIDIVTLAVFGSIFDNHFFGWSFIVFTVGTILTCFFGLLLILAKPPPQTDTQGTFMNQDPHGTVFLAVQTSQQYDGPQYAYNQPPAYSGYKYPESTS